jgi:hypothetical protein
MKKLAQFLPEPLKVPARHIRDALRRADADIRGLYLKPARRKRREALLSGLDGKREVTLFLGPEADLQPFFASHVLIARVLKDAGRTPLLLSCDGIQPICAAKLARQWTQTAPGEDNKACQNCRAVADRVGHSYGLADISIEMILGQKGLAEIEQKVSATGDRSWDLVEDGIEIGRACLGETLRSQRKLSIEELSASDKGLISALAYSSLAVYRSVKLLLERYNIRHIAYFGDYAFFIAPQILARRHGISVTNISHAYNRDIDRRFLNLRPGHGFSHMMSQIDSWAANSHRAMPADAIHSVLDGGLYRMRGFGGASTYSPNWRPDSSDVRAELGLPPGGKLLVAYSNSSDELLCNREILRVMDIPYAQTRNPFPTQIAWLKDLVAWVEARPELRLVIRLHPRMAKGHRHTSESSEAEHMRREFLHLPPNVAIVWPESKISSYNIAEHADVALTAWSSIGLELARLGMPLISAFQRVGPWPTGKFNLFSETKDGYFATVTQALQSVPTMANILDAFRWTYILNWTPLVDISDVTPDPDYRFVPDYRSPKNAGLILKAVAEGQDLAKLALAELSESAEAIAAEHAALEASLGLAFKYLVTGDYQDPPRGYTICLPDRPPVHIGDGDGPRIEVSAQNDVTYAVGASAMRRNSPLLARLARAVALRAYD